MDVGGWAVGIALAALFALVVYVVMWIVRTRRKSMINQVSFAANVVLDFE